MTSEELMAQMYAALLALPGRCQMTGGPRWHLQARLTVSKMCSRCAAIRAYEDHIRKAGNPILEGQVCGPITEENRDG